MALGATQPLTETSTRNIPGDKVLPARKADNFSTICVSRLCRNCDSLDVSQPYGPSRLVTGTALLLLLLLLLLLFIIIIIIIISINPRNNVVLYITSFRIEFYAK
jgi:hypothetical protein